MKRSSLLIALTLLVLTAVVVVSAPGASLAYLTESSGTLRNSFRVVYQDPQDFVLPVRIQKTMVNLSEEDVGPGGFLFYLLNVRTGETVAAISDENGETAMELSFTAEDVGKTYYYCLFEQNTGRENVVYDDTVYDITISLVLDEMHEIAAVITVNGQAVTEITAEFVNEYYLTIPLPDTGDDARPVLWMAMLALSAAGLVLLRKKKEIFGRM